MWGRLIDRLRQAAIVAVSAILAGLIVAAAGALAITPAAKASDTVFPTKSLAALPGVLHLDGAAWPEVLSPADRERYRKIFAHQARGEWQAADRLIAELADRVLMGHVLFQRYMHPTAYRSRFPELRDWLASYPDHPEAERIHKLALRRRPSGAAAPRRPSGSSARLGTGHVPEPAYRSARRLSAAETRRARQVRRQVVRNVLRTRLSATEDLIASAEVERLFDRVERDQMLAEVARGWFHYGRDDRALALAGPAAVRSGAAATLAPWIAGLASWRQGDVEAAARYFESLAKADYAGMWQRSAGAYWTARANLKLHRPQAMSRWLRVAARYPETFYGLLAREALGLPTVFDFGENAANASDLAQLREAPAGRRALALVEVGETSRARGELLRLPLGTDRGLARAALAVAEVAGLPALTYQLAGHLRGVADDDPARAAIPAGRYPIPGWQLPAQQAAAKTGVTVDRALIYAFIRQESKFDARATSRDGARGLMQILPSTARYIAGFGGPSGYRNHHSLYDPAVNLDLGQRYLGYLLAYDTVGRDLFRLATAYNGGPGNLGRWSRETDYGGDPLLFIESLPSRQTRHFIERVLTNLWIYRARLGQPASSLKAIAAGDWPAYVSLDRPSSEIARSAAN